MVQSLFYLPRAENTNLATGIQHREAAAFRSREGKNSQGLREERRTDRRQEEDVYNLHMCFVVIPEECNSVLNSAACICREYSKQLNESRLKVLQARENAVHELIHDAQQSLAGIAKDTAKYKTLLTDLLLQVSSKSSSYMTRLQGSHWQRHQCGFSVPHILGAACMPGRYWILLRLRLTCTS